MQEILRPYEPKDLAAVYEVCLKTGDAGNDATHLYDDPKVLGHVYAGPYVVFEPELAFVLEDDEGVCGYVLGTLDTERFNEWFINVWLPEISKAYPEPSGDPKNWTPTERFAHGFHHPERRELRTFEGYPSHLHIDLLPRAQGQGHGRKMMEIFLDNLRAKGSPAVHLGMGESNTRAYHFYKKMGFHELLRKPGVIYLGMKLE